MAPPATNDTVIYDPEPAHDDCSTTTPVEERITMRGIKGDLLNARPVTWGWFQAGVRPTIPEERHGGLQEPAPRTVPVLPVELWFTSPPVSMVREHEQVRLLALVGDRKRHGRPWVRPIGRPH
jgi:hypothetical protein